MPDPLAGLPPRFLRTPEAARFLGLSGRTLEKYPPEPLATFLVDGDYLPRDVPLIKRILALPGQTVCRTGPTVAVDGIEMGVARERDHRGRMLPVWEGCHILAGDEVFLMNWDEPTSLDGRYFGPIPLHAIVGRAVPLWTFEED